MIGWTRVRYLAPAACALVLCSLIGKGTCLASPDVPAAGLKDTAKQVATSGGTKQKADSYARQITRRGKTIVVSRALADDVKKDNQIVLSTVAIKTRLDKNGDLAGYELVQVDKGSIPENVGFRPGDRIIAVNGIPARAFAANEGSLRSASRFEVTLLRKGRTRRMVLEIRDTGR